VLSFILEEASLMMTEAKFDYYYGSENNQFSFFRIPRQLMTGKRFKRLSTEAKLLYGLLLDRMGLSAKNGWHDKAGRVYIYYTLRDEKSRRTLTAATTKRQNCWWSWTAGGAVLA